MGAKRMLLSPTTSLLPGEMYARSMRLPSSQVPLVDSRSVKSQPFSVSAISA